MLGGSFGAQRLNQPVPEMAGMAPVGELEIYQHTGGNNSEETEVEYRHRDLHSDERDDIRIVPYIDNMAEAYQWADLVLCRAGAMTVSELAVVGRSAILVPFPFAVDDHQTANGEFLEMGGAAFLIQQSELDGGKLLQMVREFIDNPQKVSEMGDLASQLAQPHATERVVSICQEFC